MESSLELYNFFKKNWSLKRTIFTLKEKALVASGQGTASFQETALNQLDYSEKVTIKYFDNNFQTEAYQKYLYKYVPAKNKLEKYFENTSFFYTLDLKENTATGCHHCKDDLYKSYYRFLDPKSFELVYRVEGPKKSYLMETLYQRA